MRISRIFLSIIIFFPIITSAHEGHDQAMLNSFQEQAGVLPGEFGYFFDRAGEWVQVNLFTLSTKQKQQKKVEFAKERLAEIVTLAEIVPGKTSALALAVVRYQGVLGEARDMAEKIIFLDGAELALTENFESLTRSHEQILAGLLVGAGQQTESSIQTALIAARLGNKDIFDFMVRNYQFTDADVKKYEQILEEHMKLFVGRSNDKRIADLLEEARKFKEAGLNIQAYELIDKAKNILYSLTNLE